VRIDVVTIFPEYLAALDLSLIGKARETGLLQVAVHDLREFTHDRHRTVDDSPAGGGAGMVMRPEPWGEALDAVVAAGQAAGQTGGEAKGQAGGPADGESAQQDVPWLLVPSPSGQVFDQALAHRLAGQPWLAFACGRYEGIDERVIEDAALRMPVLPVSLGDYVLNGGEVAVLAIVEAVARLLPGVVGNADSLVEESHEGGLLEYPVYTKPATWRGRDVPAVLQSGHHANIERWRQAERLRRTARRRPDLLAQWLEARDPEQVGPADRAVLAEEGWVLESGRFQQVSPPVAD